MHPMQFSRGEHDNAISVSVSLSRRKLFTFAEIMKYRARVERG